MTEVIAADAEGNRFRLQRIVCPICKQRNLRSIGMRGGKFQRHGRGIASEIVQCRDCELMWADPFPYPVDPSGLYGDPAKYFVDQNEAAKFEAFGDHVIRPAIHHSGKSKPSLLDVGSGRGELLRAASALGLDDIVGLEFAQGMIDAARDRHGIRLLAKTIEQYAEDAARTFDVVTFSAVLEHLYDPDAAIAAAKKLTHPGSMIYVDVPREPNLLTAVVGAAYRLRAQRAVINLAPTFPPYHVFGFSETSLAKLFARHDFEIVSTWVHSEMGFAFPNTIRGKTLKAAAKAFGAVANWTGTAVNMYIWARRKV
jgi:SAM-dependent methyltransferase